MSNNDNDIPTLGEIIFPGNPEKVAKPSDVPEPEPAAASAPEVSAAPDEEPSERPRPNSFESLISTRIDHILEKHMESAREEIVRMVMLELRARLPGTSRPNGDSE